ncbi:FN3 domain-containing metallophosphoesterase family protein [Flavihumibacter sp. CACIAM 22H1]|uniref:FN3 domain-containing metallophosphoesterase family protein n=1 Tax=Flavihumibacter sp. CACIAM 22H1 TaxID=1812911 RepID=UPI0007A91E7E|nr:FN3 domain-containing metallophosphoesterase family protein [Flavihumibacter sp. CACIAM 22H1]KYP13644.1 MAG: metallophosphoesterase [Flavihumibacter sp. CACIAM 22H1]
MSTSSLPAGDRRKFIGTLTRLTALGAIGFSPFDSKAAPLRNQGNSFAAGPYLQVVSSTSMSIRWITEVPSYSWVEYGETAELGKKAHAVTDGLVDAYNRVHEIILEDLEPGKTYWYRIVSKAILDFQPYKLVYGEQLNSDVYTLSTLPTHSRELNWLVLNDIHDQPKSFGDLIRLNGKDPYDFVFLNGDMFDYQTDEKQIMEHLLIPCSSSFATQKPFLFVRGNHETRGKYARQLKDYFTNPGGQFFSINCGPVFVLALDTGEDKPDKEEVYAGIVDFDQYRRRQAIWLEKQLQSRAARKARFRVVMMHIPTFYSGDWHGTLHCRELFSPLFDKYKVDLVIAGHTHKYGIHPPVKGQHNYPIVIGGGPKEGKRTLIKVRATEEALNLQMLRDDGEQVGTYTIN